MSRRGFTLMEFLVALSVFAALSAALGHSLRTGIDAWRRGRRSADLRQQARVALEDLARELRSSVPVRGGWSGEEDSFSFYTAPGSADGELARVSYRKVQGAGTFAVLQKRRLLFGAREKAEEAGGHLTDVPTEVHFAYAYRGDPTRWESRWEDEDGPPAGVRVELSLTDPASGETLSFKKTADVPSAGLKAWKGR